MCVTLTTIYRTYTLLLSIRSGIWTPGPDKTINLNKCKIFPVYPDVSCNDCHILRRWVQVYVVIKKSL